MCLCSPSAAAASALTGTITDRPVRRAAEPPDTVLIVMDRLSRDLEQGCRVQADPSGTGYLLDDPAGRRDVERIEKPAYQREILGYLRSGAAFLWVRGDGLQLTPETAARVERSPVLFERGRWTIRAGSGR